MSIQEPAVIRSHIAIRSHNHWIRIGYVTFVLVALAAIYFASGGPGATEANLATAMP